MTDLQPIKEYLKPYIEHTIAEPETIVSAETPPTVSRNSNDDPETGSRNDSSVNSDGSVSNSSDKSNTSDESKDKDESSSSPESTSESSPVDPKSMKIMNVVQPSIPTSEEDRIIRQLQLQSLGNRNDLPVPRQPNLPVPQSLPTFFPMGPEFPPDRVERNRQPQLPILTTNPVLNLPQNNPVPIGSGIFPIMFPLPSPNIVSRNFQHPSLGPSEYGFMNPVLTDTSKFRIPPRLYPPGHERSKLELTNPEVIANRTNFNIMFSKLFGFDCSTRNFSLQLTLQKFRKLPLDIQLEYFVISNTLTLAEMEVRQSLLIELATLLLVKFPHSEIYPFGSMMTFLAGTDSDIDIVVDVDGKACHQIICTHPCFNLTVKKNY